MLKDTKESLNTDKFLQIHNIYVIDPRRDMNSFYESSRMFIQTGEKKSGLSMDHKLSRSNIN